MITLSDKAFQSQELSNDRPLQQWDQAHLGVALKFAVETPRWHCIWATLQEYDQGSCVFRSYNDVYLEKLQRSPRKRTHTPRNPSFSYAK